MQDILVVICIATSLLFLVGMVKPALFKDKKTGLVPERKIIAGGSIGLFAIAIALYSYFDESLPPQSQLSVTREEYGERWPLIADRATLHCEVPDIAYIEVGGIAYALNGGALRAGFPRGDDIRSNVEIVSMADFIERSMKICMDKI